jgi:hypothetical protein
MKVFIIDSKYGASVMLCRETRVHMQEKSGGLLAVHHQDALCERGREREEYLSSRLRSLDRKIFGARQIAKFLGVICVAQSKNDG